MDKHGLCSVMYFRAGNDLRDIFKLIFSPDRKDEFELVRENTGQTYWGNDEVRSVYDFDRSMGYNPRRQSLMLLFIEVLKDEVYLKNHFPDLLKD